MKESIEVLKPPCEEQLENFWRPLYETPVQHKENEWINTIISENRERQALEGMGPAGEQPGQGEPWQA